MDWEAVDEPLGLKPGEYERRDEPLERTVRRDSGSVVAGYAPGRRTNWLSEPVEDTTAPTETHAVSTSLRKIWQGYILEMLDVPSRHWPATQRVVVDWAAAAGVSKWSTV